MSQSHSSGKLRIGTRGSKLARVQTDIVQALLSRAGADCEAIPLKTSGDRIQDRSLADAGGKGLFTKELEDALRARIRATRFSRIKQDRWRNWPKVRGSEPVRCVDRHR